MGHRVGAVERACHTRTSFAACAPKVCCAMRPSREVRHACTDAKISGSVASKPARYAEALGTAADELCKRSETRYLARRSGVRGVGWARRHWIEAERLDRGAQKAG